MKTITAKCERKTGYDLKWVCPYCGELNITDAYEENGKVKEECYSCFKPLTVKWGNIWDKQK